MKMKLAVLFLGACVVLAMVLLVRLHPNTNMQQIGHIPDFNKITKENEWHAAFAPLEVYGSQVTQKHGRIFKTGDEETSEAEINEVLERIAK